MAVSGNRVVLGAGNGALLVCSLSTGELLWEAPKAHDKAVSGVAVHGKSIVSGSWDKSTKAWKV